MKALVDAIVEAVCDTCGVTMEDLSGARRHRHIVDARAVLVWFLRRLANVTVDWIGDKLLNRDHTTICFYSARADERAATDPTWQLVAGTVAQRIREADFVLDPIAAIPDVAPEPPPIRPTRKECRRGHDLEGNRSVRGQCLTCVQIRREQRDRRAKELKERAQRAADARRRQAAQTARQDVVAPAPSGADLVDRLLSLRVQIETAMPWEREEMLRQLQSMEVKQ